MPSLLRSVAGGRGLVMSVCDEHRWCWSSVSSSSKMSREWPVEEGHGGGGRVRRGRGGNGESVSFQGLEVRGEKVRSV